MNINLLKNAVKIGEFSINTSLKKKNLNFIKDVNLNHSDYKKEEARVYFITIDDNIVKIGGSNAKGGICGTISPYCSGNGGRPSDRTFGVNYLIHESLQNNKQVALYAQWMPPVEARVPSLFGTSIEKVNYSYKPMEEACVSEYLRHNDNKYPIWNLQEAGKPWPTHIQEARRKLLGGK